MLASEGLSTGENSPNCKRKLVLRRKKKNRLGMSRERLEGVLIPLKGEVGERMDKTRFCLEPVWPLTERLGEPSAPQGMAEMLGLLKKGSKKKNEGAVRGAEQRCILSSGEKPLIHWQRADYKSFGVEITAKGTVEG